MATIIPLSTRSRTGPSSRTEGGTAEIVIFPGVRYEYHSEAPAKEKRRRNAKRDILELAD